jgi:hypothetical protein
MTGIAGMNPSETPFELILSHQYHHGAALDSSGFENHGRVEGPALAEGRLAGTRALGFDGVGDRIVIPPSRSLRDIRALRVDATVFLDELGGRRTILEGFSSFALLVEPDGVLEGTIYNGSRWEGVRGPEHGMPLRRWVRITYVYDGLNTSVLYLDDEELALDMRPLGEMEPVSWPFGLNVGAWPDRNHRMFKGKIEEIQVWRRPREPASRPPAPD